ncbi:hypothetical protein DPMN_066275 [Dreissena polymorpha]|uniref:G-protein coupled receptors family 1 profile domain-containing protein n=2 Tax=Dreissena polymorpha TaxID=45954 RepID=A0A9D3YW18_DREPO|nr:hypothetical protein DPMN_066275 [Dreissena polymorpha]
MCIAIVGNTITCVIVYRKTVMRTAKNLLLTNIALSDIVLSCTVMPFLIFKTVFPERLVDLRLCVSISMIKDVLVAVSTFTLMIISADRFLIVVHKKDRLTVPVSKLCITGTWAVAILFTMVQLESNSREAILHDLLFCYQHAPSSRIAVIYTVTFVTLTFIIPLAVMFYLFATILRTVQLICKKVHIHTGSNLNIAVTQYSSKIGLPPVATRYTFMGDFEAKRRAFGTIFLLFITLFICWVSYMSERIFRNTGSNEHTSGDLIVELIFISIGFMKSALYPVIFCARNRRFRSACGRIFTIKLCLFTKCVVLKSRRIRPRNLYVCPESVGHL